MYQTSKFVGAVRYNVPRICAALSCRALRRVTRMCSSTLSDPANRLLKRTDSEGSSSVAEKKPDCRPPIFAAAAGLGNLRQTSEARGKVGVQSRKENRRLSFLFAHRRGYGVVPAAGAATLPPLRRRANPPAEVQRKTLRPLRVNSPARFKSPAQPVQKKVPPGKGRTRLRSSRTPSRSGAKNARPLCCFRQK